MFSSSFNTKLVNQYLINFEYVIVYVKLSHGRVSFNYPAFVPSYG